MELNSYQSVVLQDLSRFLDILQEKKNIKDSYTEFWECHDRTPLTPTLGEAIEPYDNSVKGCPHVCMKVPTAGGKTFIACSSLKVIFDHFGREKKRAVVWLVPSDAILKQTLNNLKNTDHPYRQKIDIDFSGKVEVYNKMELLNGAGISIESVSQNLSIFVMSFDSFRATNKEGRKVYQDNGSLQKLSSMIDKQLEDEEISVMRILQSLNPVVIVDESHNATSELSVKMLNDLNPSLVLDLTATPRKNSNILSFVPAIELKKANMIKLPVIVSNQNDKHSVINTAIYLQKQLEVKADASYKAGTDSYIRPIVLFQAQPKKGEENTTYDKIKQILIKKGIPEEQIKIKTSDKNELDGINLADSECNVRFIITVNALKEGWDCPFAYILASLADRTSTIDVEQILGRVLRLPYTRRHSVSELNLSYVLTSSNDFLNTMNQIVKGLNAAGFTDKDYRVANPTGFVQPSIPTPKSVQPELDLTEKRDDFDFIIEESNPSGVSVISDTSNQGNIDSQSVSPEMQSISDNVSSIMERATEEDKNFSEEASKLDENQQQGNIYIPTEMENQVMKARINDVFKDSASSVILPQFGTIENVGDLFGGSEKVVLFDKNTLLEEFKLGKADTNIDFTLGKTNIYKVDLSETNRDNTPTFSQVDGRQRDHLLRLLSDPKQRPAMKEAFASTLFENIGNMYPIADAEIKKYIDRVIEDFTDAQFTDLASNDYSYSQAIKNKINQLSKEYVKNNFKIELTTNKIKTLGEWKLPLEKPILKTCPAIDKSLYNKEDQINGFELEVINAVANMDNVEWWTRNREKKDFCINGFINHYPDFIIKTKNGNIILLETKGDHLDASDKIELGRLWESKAGNNFKYFMVYENRIVEGSYTKDEFLAIAKEL